MEGKQIPVGACEVSVTVARLGEGQWKAVTEEVGTRYRYLPRSR